MARSDDRVRLDHPFPMVRVEHRRLDPDFEGPVFVWDVDKTYLETRFSQLKGLLRIPFELGVDKQPVPGTVPLLRALRGGPDGREHRPLFFVSASPPQLHKAITARMLIDGVELDGITYKDWAAVLRRRQLDQLKGQVAFKLSALLRLGERMPLGARLHLYGDDAEKDALIYGLAGDVLAGRLRGAALERTLAGLGVRPEHAGRIATFADGVPAREAVARIYIHLIRQRDGRSLAGFGPTVVGWPTAAAAAELARDADLISEAAARGVAAACAPSQPVAAPEAADPGGWLMPAAFR